MFEKPIIQTTDSYRKIGTTVVVSRTIYYGEVITIDDPTDGGMIKVRIDGLDKGILNADLPWCYPFTPKFFHSFPKVGEIVRILIEDIKYPQRSRFWTGSVISQLQSIEFDTSYTALSTTNMAVTNPQPSVSTYPDADGVYPLKEDVAIIGRINTDIILSLNKVSIRAGKHENDNVLKLNVKNPATIDMIFEPIKNTSEYYSNTILQSDKIALISHSGNPQFKAARLTPADRQRIFDEGHPLGRADLIVQALKIIKDAIKTHIHPYSGVPADVSEIISTLDSIDFDAILQKNIVIN